MNKQDAIDLYVETELDFHPEQLAWLPVRNVPNEIIKFQQ